SPFWFTGVGAPPSEPVMITADKSREVAQPTVVSNAMAATVPPPYAALRPNEMEADMPNRDRRTAPGSDGSPGSPDRLPALTATLVPVASSHDTSVVDYIRISYPHSFRADS